jgi:NAD(P)-dependent dehydrogenase (short-subunit alcohol dehydrogenase family)
MTLGSGLATQLAEALRTSGAAVAVIAPDNHTESAESVISADLSTSNAAIDALQQAEDALGEIDTVVIVPSSRCSLRAGELLELDAETWAVLAEEPIGVTLWCLQAARALFGSRGGRIVLVTPSASMTGSGHFVAGSAAAEGARSLAKATARQWGPCGITINTVAVPVDLLYGERDDRAPADRAGLPAPAIGRVPDVPNDIAAVVAAVGSDLFASVTGVTIAVDGGVWMTA